MLSAAGGRRRPTANDSPAARRAAQTSCEEDRMSSTMHEPGTAGDRYQSTGGISGWIVFAGVIMLIEGFLDAMWGLAAVINNEVITVGGRGGVVVWDISAWGWGHLILGSIVALTGLGLLAGASWARFLGIIFVTLDVL